MTEPRAAYVRNRTNKVLELLHAHQLTALQVADRMSITEQNARKSIRTLVSHGVVWIAGAFGRGRHRAPIYTAKGQPISNRSANGNARGLERCQQYARWAKGRYRPVDEPNWNGPRNAEHESAEQRAENWLNDWLGRWADWMREDGSEFKKLLYPTTAAGTEQSASNYAASEHDCADYYERHRVPAIVASLDACIDSLRPSERAAVYLAWGLSEDWPQYRCPL